MKKLLAILTAITMAAAMTVAVFAADSGSFTMTADGSWWLQKDFTELTGESIEGHQSITFTAPTGANLVIAVTDSDGNWTQSEAALTHTIDLSGVSAVFVILSNGDTADYEIEWAFVDDAAAEEAPAADETETETPAETEAETPAATETETAPATAAAETSPNTGIALAVAPAIAALAAMTVTKRK